MFSIALYAASEEVQFIKLDSLDSLSSLLSESGQSSQVEFRKPRPGYTLARRQRCRRRLVSLDA